MAAPESNARFAPNSVAAPESNTRFCDLGWLRGWPPQNVRFCNLRRPSGGRPRIKREVLRSGAALRGLAAPNQTRGSGDLRRPSGWPPENKHEVLRSEAALVAGRPRIKREVLRSEAALVAAPQNQTRGSAIWGGHGGPPDKRACPRRERHRTIQASFARNSDRDNQGIQGSPN